MAEIQLKGGRVATVDAKYVQMLSQHSWYESTGGYAVAVVGRSILSMHRIILSAEDGALVDHRDGDPLNNRVCNLRMCTHAQNMRNRKMHKNNACGAKGVYLDSRKRLNPYRAQICVDGLKIALGSFATLTDASDAYKAAAVKYHGEFARL